MGAIGGESCSLKNGGPSNVKVDLVSNTGDLVSSALTSSSGSYLFKNIFPGMGVSQITATVGVLRGCCFYCIIFCISIYKRYIFGF